MNATRPLEIPRDYAPAADAVREHTILITGAGNGIGRALARAAAAAGATVVMLDRQVGALEKVYDQIEAAGHPQPALYPMELAGATPDDMVTLAERLRERFGGLDGLVHNAAELGKPAPLAHYDVQVWLRTVHVNLNAPFLLTRYLLPLLHAAPAGRLLFVGDRAGRCGQPYLGAYGVSKWGLEGLIRTVAAELDPKTNLRVASVDPGPAHTALRRKGWPAEPAETNPSPERIADNFLYFLDPSITPQQGGAYRRP